MQVNLNFEPYTYGMNLKTGIYIIWFGYEDYTVAEYRSFQDGFYISDGEGFGFNTRIFDSSIIKAYAKFSLPDEQIDKISKEE